MTHYKDRYSGRELCFDEGDNVGYDEGGWACETFLGGGVDAAAPAALIEAMDFDSSGSKGREEFVISVYVVAEAVDEDEFCERGGVGLELSARVLFGCEAGRGKGEGGRGDGGGRINFPGLGVEGEILDLVDPFDFGGHFGGQD